VSTRLKRALRLVELAETAERSARAQASAAERALAEAKEEARQSETAWLAAAAVDPDGVVNAADLMDSEAYLRTLRARADAALQKSDRASTEAGRCASEIVLAATERRKLELWRDRIAEGDRTEENRRERIASDELAARSAARGRI
jgi:flagellar biosynthesis chaperone FliJ